jgi:hypothetical protein
LFDVADDSVFVDNEGSAAADEPFLVKNAVGFDHLSLDVAEQREGHTDVFTESLVSGVAVNTDADDLRITFLEIGDISLIRLKLFRSTAGEGEHVEGERDILLTPEIRELHGLSVRVCESEIRRCLSNFELRLRGARLLGIATPGVTSG